MYGDNELWLDLLVQEQNCQLVQYDEYLMNGLLLGMTVFSQN